MKSLKEIDARIAELEELLRTELSVEGRVLKSIAEYSAKRTKEAPPKSPPAELVRRMEEASEFLQLQSSEIKLFESGIRAARLINPCYVPARSPTSRCAFNAVSCSHWKWTTGTASASCTCNTSAELNPKGSAYGYGSQGWSQAVVYGWCWFEITPAYPNATFVTVNPRIDIHGFYILNSGQIPPSVKLELMARGYQYGYSWGEKREIVVNESGDTMGRFDATKYLNFQMPVGADPFRVLVMAILKMNAKGSGSSAVGDFATGNGNKIEIPYVNTWG